MFATVEENVHTVRDSSWIYKPYSIQKQKYKAISMMRGKSLQFEIIFRENQVQQLFFLENSEREIISFLSNFDIIYRITPRIFLINRTKGHPTRLKVVDFDTSL